MIQERNVQIVCGAGMVSGKEIMSLNLATGMRGVGWNVEFVTSRWGDAKFVSRLEEDCFKYQRLRLGFISASVRIKPLLMTIDQLRFWPSLAYQYNRLIESSVPRAVIHTNWQHALLLLPLLKTRRDIFWAQELFPNNPHYALVLRAIANRVGRVVCVSHAVARSVLALGVPKSRVSVIHNGCSFVESKPSQVVRKELRLGIVGQIGPWKGHDDLIDALALLARDGISVSVSIFGTGDPGYIKTLRARLAGLNLEDRVEWPGFVSNQADIYREVDVCVQPSRFEEPFGMTAVEAGGFSCPVVCSDRGGLPEIVEDGVTGFVVGVHRPDQLARALRSFFVERPSLIKKMGGCRPKASSK